jgi:hypothetical protein
LRNADLVKDIAEMEKRVDFKNEQLKQLIAFPYLNEDGRQKYDQLIDIGTEELTVHTWIIDFKILSN